MSNAHDHPTADLSDAHDGPHEGPIRTPTQLIWAVALGFVVPIIVIVMMASFVAYGIKPASGSQAMDEAAVAARIQPVGMVTYKNLADLSTLKTGEQVFQAQCAACHATGAAGAPKLGDGAAWKARIATGYEALLHSALAGKGNMGAQGGGDFTDLEVGRAVVYMTNQAGASFAEPKPPATAASAASAVS